MVSVFKKLFARKESPKNSGKVPALSKAEGTRWVKTFILQLANMEGTPSYKLSHQLTVGSEVGNIVIADPSVSPRHCTFILQEEVISVLDHGSVAGTYINNKQIAPGRYFILEESDSIRVGDLEIAVHTRNEAALAEEDIPKVELPEEEEIQEEVEEIVVVKTKKAKKSLWDHFKPKKKAPVKKKNAAISIANNSPYAANSLVRLIAVISDLLIAYILFVVFFPFDEFRSFIADVPVQLGELLQIDFSGLALVVQEEHPFIGEISKDLLSFFSSTFHLFPIFILFIVVRLTTTLMLGVSLSEAMLGIRSHGNAAWKRIGGGVRVLLGVVTGPLLIFDIPAVISRRTFKEFMTFTHTYISSKFLSILGIILYLPLLVALALFSPLFQGLELLEPIAVNERLEMRVKVAPIEGAQLVVNKTERSQFLSLELVYDSQNTSIIPLFKFSGKSTKINFRPALAVLQRDLQRSVQVEVYKTFDLKELLSMGIKGDYLLQQKFPDLESFVYSSDLASTSFKTKNDDVSRRKFADEMVSFTKLAFELNALNAWDVMQTYSPFIKGLSDYRASFLALVEYKEFDQIDFIKLGNAYFLRFSYTRQKPFDLIIPLIKGEGRILKVEFDKKENLSLVRNKFYKFSFNDADWFPEKNAIVPAAETLSSLEVVDFFSKITLKGDKIRPDRAQALYGYYFEKSADVFRKENPLEFELWKKSVEDVFVIMESLKKAKTETPEAVTEEDPLQKLIQNFQDLKDAVESRNKEFFGVSDSTTI